MRGEMIRTEGEMMTGTGEGMTREEGEGEMLRKTEAEVAGMLTMEEMMTVEEMMTAEEEGEMKTQESVGETMTEESAGETMTEEGITATKGIDMAKEMKEELDMKSVVGEIGMKVGEIEITEERGIGKVEAPRKEMAEVQARGTIEEIGMEIIRARREITKGKKGLVRSRKGERGRLREGWIG